MLDLVKKAMLTGIGIASISKDKVEEIARDLMEQGNISEKEGRKFVEEMMGYAEKSKGDIESYLNKNIDKAIDKAIGRLDLVRRSDVEELQKSINELQERLVDKE